MPSFRPACRGRRWALPGTRLWATEEPEGHGHAGQVASRHGADGKAWWDGGLQSESPGLLSSASCHARKPLGPPVSPSEKWYRPLKQSLLTPRFSLEKGLRFRAVS